MTCAPKLCLALVYHLLMIENLHDIDLHRLQVVDVSKDTVAIRSIDWDRDRFDIEFGYVVLSLSVLQAFGQELAKTNVLCLGSHVRLLGIFMPHLSAPELAL